MMPYIWALGTIWSAWFVGMVAASVYADVSTDGNDVVLPWLAFLGGGLLAVVLTAVAVAGIAAGQCWDACERRSRVEP